MTDRNIRLFVSALRGDDGHSGTEEQPFYSIERARDELRARAQQEGGLKGDAVVWIGEGDYEMTSPLRFDERDSGADGCTITYRNRKGEQPVLIGGRHLNQGWSHWQEGIYRIHLGEGCSLHTLFENGVRSHKARSPKTGYHIAAGNGRGKGGSDFSFHREDLPERFDTSSAQVYIWPGEGEWNWFTETKSVTVVDFEEAVITLKEPAPWGIDCGSRYRLQGALQLLTEPGEFHWDEQAGELYYYPRALPIDEQRIVVPMVKRVLDIRGSSLDEAVSGLVFEGLTVEVSDFTHEYRMPRNNCEYPEAREGLVYMENAERIAILGCRLRHSGFSGVMLNGSCRNNRIEGNIIEHIGYNGIYLVGPEPGEGSFRNVAESHTNKLHTIRNNWIRSCGELVGHGSGIQLYQSGDNSVTHNRIQDMPRYGISIKGLRYQLMAGRYYDEEVTWDNHWNFLHARNNLIAWNDISDVMKDSQDGGMFESWGAGRGNRVIGNRFHHSGIYFSFGFCIYLDDASDDYLISHNVIHDLFGAGSGVLWFVIFAKGIGSCIENNLLVRNKARAAFGTQEMAGEANREITIRRNIVCNSGEQLYHFVNWDDSRLLEADHNLFYHDAQKPTVSGIYGDDKRGHSPVSWAAWREVMGGEFDAHTLNVDPLLHESKESESFQLLADSPAYAIGWETIDMRQIGLTDEFPYSQCGTLTSGT